MVRKYFDIIFSNNIEDKIKRARELGYYGLIVLIKDQDDVQKYLKINFPLYFGVLIEGNNRKELIKKIKKMKSERYIDIIIIRTDKISILRKILNFPLIGILDPEKNDEKDNMLYFKGGIDKGIITKILNNRGFLIWSLDLNEKIIRRRLQNSRIIKKYGLITLIGSFAEDSLEIVPPKVLLGYARMFGLGYETISNNFIKIINLNRRFRNPDYLTENSYVYWRYGMDCYEY